MSEARYAKLVFSVFVWGSLLAPRAAMPLLSPALVDEEEYPWRARREPQTKTENTNLAYLASDTV